MEIPLFNAADCWRVCWEEEEDDGKQTDDAEFELTLKFLGAIRTAAVNFDRSCGGSCCGDSSFSSLSISEPSSSLNRRLLMIREIKSISKIYIFRDRESGV
jgi:hypothetical protein